MELRRRFAVVLFFHRTQKKIVFEVRFLYTNFNQITDIFSQQKNVELIIIKEVQRDIRRCRI